MKLLATLCLSLLLLASCTDFLESDISIDNPTTEDDCTTVLCTEEFRTIAVRAVDKNENPFILTDDDITVYYTASEETIDIDRSYLSDLSSFFIASDASDIAFEGTSITVELSISKFKTVKREFIIAKDCCHVFNPEGQSLVIEI